MRNYRNALILTEIFQIKNNIHRKRKTQTLNK